MTTNLTDAGSTRYVLFTVKLRKSLLEDSIHTYTFPPQPTLFKKDKWYLSLKQRRHFVPLFFYNIRDVKMFFPVFLYFSRLSHSVFLFRCKMLLNWPTLKIFHRMWFLVYFFLLFFYMKFITTQLNHFEKDY